MPAIPVPSLAGDLTRWNNRDYIAVDDSGTLVWEQDHNGENWYYIRDYADEFSDPGGPNVNNTNRAYFEFEDFVLAAKSTGLVPVSTERWTFPKPYLSRPSLAIGTSFIGTLSGGYNGESVLFNANATSTGFCAVSSNLVAPHSTNITALGEQTPPSVPEYNQLPAPAPLDECDHDGRHLWAAWDGVKWVWDWNFRAYAAVDDRSVAEGYLKFGNLLLCMVRPPPTPKGTKTALWPSPYDVDTEPIVATEIVATHTSNRSAHVMHENPPDPGVGYHYRQQVSSSTHTTERIDILATGAIQYPYDPPLRWPVPNFIDEKFHYRGRDYIAKDVGGFFAWEMDPDAYVRMETDFSGQDKKLILQNSIQFLGGRSDNLFGDRTITFSFSGFSLPPFVISTAVDEPGGSPSADDTYSNCTSIPTETQFSARPWDSGSGGTETAQIDYIAAGLSLTSLLAKLIVGWTFDGSGTADKPEIRDTGWDFRAFGGSAQSEYAVKNYGVCHLSTTDPADDRWFNLETAAWHNSGNAYFDGQTDFGISFWFYPYSTGTGNVGVLLSMSDDGSPIEIIYDDNTGKTITLQVHDVDTSVYSTPTVGLTGSLDTWNFIYFGWDSATKTLSVIHNDNARQTAVVAVTLPFEELDDGEPLTLFRRTDTTAPVKGGLDEMYFWSDDLTDDEVARLYNEGNGVQGLNF